MSQINQKIVALVTYGNLYLQGLDTDFNVEDHVTKHCNGFDFTDPPIHGIAGSAKLLAPDAYKWFEYLKGQRAKRIRLHYSPSFHNLPPHISAAFAGGVSKWSVEVQFEDKSHLYMCGWVPNDGIFASSWKTHYVCLERNSTHLEGLKLSVSEARALISSILKGIIEFAEQFDYTQNWASNFSHSLTTLDEFRPTDTGDFIPHGIYSIEARQLIETAFRSDVFGGMGSWNDLAFSGEDQEKYVSLSEELHEAICNAIAVGVNSFP